MVHSYLTTYGWLDREHTLLLQCSAVSAAQYGKTYRTCQLHGVSHCDLGDSQGSQQVVTSMLPWCPVGARYLTTYGWLDREHTLLLQCSAVSAAQYGKTYRTCQLHGVSHCDLGDSQGSQQVVTSMLPWCPVGARYLTTYGWLDREHTLLLQCSAVSAAQYGKTYRTCQLHGVSHCDLGDSQGSQQVVTSMLPWCPVGARYLTTYGWLDREHTLLLQCSAVSAAQYGKTYRTCQLHGVSHCDLGDSQGSQQVVTSMLPWCPVGAQLPHDIWLVRSRAYASAPMLSSLSSSVWQNLSHVPVAWGKSL